MFHKLLLNYFSLMVMYKSKRTHCITWKRVNSQHKLSSFDFSNKRWFPIVWAEVLLHGNRIEKSTCFPEIRSHIIRLWNKHKAFLKVRKRNTKKKIFPSTLLPRFPLLLPASNFPPLFTILYPKPVLFLKSDFTFI